MSTIVQCNTCGETREVLITPTGVVVLPKGWKQDVVTVKNVPSPRIAVHECGKLECRLVGNRPPDDVKQLEL